MKVLLTILCALMILLAGGFVLASAGELDQLALISLLVIVPNALLIAAMYGISRPVRPLFMLLAVVDFLVALTAGGCTISLAGGDVELLLLGFLIGGAFVLKGGLTWAVSKRLQGG